MTLPLVTTARGIRLYDEDGADYLDGSSGVLNVNLGHSHPAILQAITEQLQHVTFVHRSQFRSQPLTELTHELSAIAPPGVSHIEYSNSGSEANETALRLTLAYQDRRGQPERTLVLSEQPSYHGMTAGALAITGEPSKRHPAFTPLVTNHTATPRVRPRPGALRADHSIWADAIQQAGPDRVAAVIVEPVGGASSGAAPMDIDTLRWLRRTADRHGFLLIADEVMSGFGRTGRWFACDHADTTPDLLTSGKGLTCGYTSLAVTFIADHITRAFDDTPIGSVVLGHTMSGNPLAAATSLAVLRHLRAHNIPDRAAASGTALHHRLEYLCDQHPVITAVRGRGLMLALGLAGHPDHQPLSTAHRLIGHARHRGLVLCPSGIDATTESVMIAPPLNSTPDELDELVTRLDTALTDLTDLTHSLRTDSATPTNQLAR
jgi:adenosylmethionine-8-amino-7-oxononanoate aminotransferase